MNSHGRSASPLACIRDHTARPHAAFDCDLSRESSGICAVTLKLRTKTNTCEVKNSKAFFSSPPYSRDTYYSPAPESSHSCQITNIPCKCTVGSGRRRLTAGFTFMFHFWATSRSSSSDNSIQKGSLKDPRRTWMLFLSAAKIDCSKLLFFCIVHTVYQKETRYFSSQFV